MSNGNLIKYNDNNTYYFLSKAVKVFPCSYRGNYILNDDNSSTGYTFDPESRLHTEYNFTHIPGYNNIESYVISYDDTNKLLKCVIGGYYFELTITDEDKTTLSNATIGITLSELDLKVDADSNDGSGAMDSERHTYILAPVGAASKTTAGYAALDSEYNSNYIFIGLAADKDNEAFDASLTNIFNSDGTLNQALLLPTLEHGSGKGSIKTLSGIEATNTLKPNTASGDYSFAQGMGTTASGSGAYSTGNYTEAVGDYSFTSGNHTKAKGEGDFVVGNNTESYSETTTDGNGMTTTKTYNYQTVVGRYNEITEGEFIVGTGALDVNDSEKEVRKNSLVINKNEITLKDTLKIVDDSNNTVTEITPTEANIKTKDTADISSKEVKIDGTAATIITTETLTANSTDTKIISSNTASVMIKNAEKISISADRTAVNNNNFALTYNNLDLNSDTCSTFITAKEANEKEPKSKLTIYSTDELNLDTANIKVKITKDTTNAPFKVVNHENASILKLNDSGNLYLKGDITSNNISDEGNLITLDKNTKIKGDLNVTGDSSVNGTFFSTGQIKNESGGLAINGDATFSGTIEAKNKILITNSATTTTPTYIDLDSIEGIDATVPIKTSKSLTVGNSLYFKGSDLTDGSALIYTGKEDYQVMSANKHSMSLKSYSITLNSTDLDILGNIKIAVNKPISSSKQISSDLTHTNKITLNTGETDSNKNKFKITINNTDALGIGYGGDEVVQIKKLRLCLGDPWNGVYSEYKVDDKGKLTNDPADGAIKNVEPLAINKSTKVNTTDSAFGIYTSNNATLSARQFWIDYNGNINTNGNITAKSYNATSDQRLKENIKSFEYKKSILDLPIYTFDFINGPKEQIGFLAQDLQKIYPDLVNNDSNGYLSIQETKLVYLLLEEIKELKTKISILEGK